MSCSYNPETKEVEMTFTVNGGVSPAPNTRIIKSPWEDVEETRTYTETYTIDASAVPLVLMHIPHIAIILIRPATLQLRIPYRRVLRL